MKSRMRFLRGIPIACALLAFGAPPASAQLYRTTLIQAAPGRLLELVDVVKARVAVMESAGESHPYLLRHSQGDHWDLMLLEPIGESLGGWYSADRIARRARAASSGGMPDEEYTRRLRELSAWSEDEIVRGPAVDRVAGAFKDNTFAHVEMFIALAGHHDELLKERAMENAFALAIGRPENLIFVRVSGAAWDSFTIGNYRDMVQYATSAVVPPEKEDAAAKAAGFTSRAAIGPYLRSLISSHHDNLLGVVR